jgi:hypothetical protein
MHIRIALEVPSRIKVPSRINRPGRRGDRLNAQPITELVAFEARCEARAILYTLGEFELSEAVDVLQADGVARGLVAEIGQDAVQVIMARAFQAVRA